MGSKGHFMDIHGKKIKYIRPSGNIDIIEFNI